MKSVIIEKSLIHGKNEIKCILLNIIIAKYTDEIRNSTFNFRTSFQWNRNGKTGTQLPKLLSFHLRTSLWFYQTSHSGTFCFTPGWMKKRVPDYLRFVFWNEMIKLPRQFVQNDDTRKINLFQNLQRLLSCTLMSAEKPRSCRFEERNWINFSFFVNANACSNISVSKPASFDTISTKISQFCSFVFVVAFSVFGNVICGTAVSFFWNFHFGRWEHVWRDHLSKNVYIPSCVTLIRWCVNFIEYLR